MGWVKSACKNGSIFPCNLQLLTIIKKIDVINKEENKVLFYIGELLEISHSSGTDAKFQFFILVSIVDMLVTHSPDYKRYNVEDSISKQFILKACLIVYNKSQEESLDVLKKNFKLFYEIRSKIAHGELDVLNNIFLNNSADEHIDVYLYSLSLKLYKYIQLILFVYLDDPEYIRFIKVN